jgi:serine/threonine-protein kinase
MGCLSEATIVSFVKGELSDDGAAWVDEHMATCAECRGLVADSARSFGLGDDSETDGDQGSGAVTRPGQEGATLPRTARRGDPPRHLEPGQRVGRYVISGVIGWGGMGIVYAAQDPSLNRRITLKFLRDDRSPRGDSDRQAWLLREAQAMAQLSHPNVVSVYDVGTYEAQVFVAMEFVEGQTLKEWLRDQTRGWREVLAAFIEAGRGLAAAHAAGVIHRDFKPANVLVGSNGRVRVTDFGLAHAIEGRWEVLASTSKNSFGAWHLGRNLTETGVVKGTPAYMAPEQFLGGRTDARTDQFSFCVALYQGIYGQRPFRGETPDALVENVVHERVLPPPKNSAVPPTLHAILRRGLSRQLGQRYATMDALLTALGDALERPTVPAGQRRIPRWATGAALALAALAAAFVPFAMRRTRAPVSAPPVVVTASADQAGRGDLAPVSPRAAPAPPASGPSLTPAAASPPRPVDRRKRAYLHAKRGNRAPSSVHDPSSRKSNPKRAYDDSPMAPSFARKAR